jgi:hypothetical protein
MIAVGILETNAVGIIEREHVTCILGIPGPEGPPGIGFIWRGTYNPTYSYVKGDAVGYSAMVYICDVACIDVLPTETGNWSLLLGNTLEAIDCGSWD